MDIIYEVQMYGLARRYLDDYIAKLTKKKKERLDKKVDRIAKIFEGMPPLDVIYIIGALQCGMLYQCYAEKGMDGLQTGIRLLMAALARAIDAVEKAIEEKQSKKTIDTSVR